jgi:23S rRNA (pseudouridine1915-N3)-methyltransferase
MRVVIAAVGRLKAGPERLLLDRYVGRTNAGGKRLGLSLLVREFPDSAAQNPETRKDREAEAILAAVPAKAPLIALDEGGKSLKSADFARRLAAWRDDGTAEIVFAIGGADGLGETVRRRAQLTLAFGAMTLPHQLVRILLAEQIYRAVTILSGHPYHRE